jgi:excinuclease ABC subunit C
MRPPDDLPAKPGIYFFKDDAGEVLYIGKARSLRDRVRTYFQPTDDPKVRHILAEVDHVDYLLTGSEREAAFIENNYIQQYQPKFNLRLKDDKSFPYLRLTVQEAVPGVYFDRRVAADGARYFGPFSPAREARRTIQVLTRHFRLRTCQDPVFRGRKRACLEYDLGLCSGPCVGLIPAESYRESVRNALLFLEGRTEELAAVLKARMRDAAEARAFEEAARLRDLLRTLDQVRIKPKAISVGLEDQDIVGYAQAGAERTAHVFLMRAGKLRESRELVLEGDPGASPEEVLRGLLRSFYADRKPPARILVPFPPADAAAVRAFLAGRAGRKVVVSVPARGRGRTLLELAAKNAEILLRKRADVQAALSELRERLDLPALPVRIDGFDVSNTQGTEVVASLVTFRDGRPWKDGYRKFRIKGVDGPNDVASLEEALQRRYLRALEEKDELPDLVLVDGGKPQLAAARRTLERVGLAGLPLASLAKREEVIFRPGRAPGIRLDRTSGALKLVQYVRDEAHRFALKFHRERRAKRGLGKLEETKP